MKARRTTTKTQGKAQAEAAGPLHSLRLLRADDQSCAECGQAAGSGLVGHRDAEPLCGLCLLNASPALGMVVQLVSLSRWFRRLNRETPRDPALRRSFLVFVSLFDMVMRNQGHELKPMGQIFEGLVDTSSGEAKKGCPGSPTEPEKPEPKQNRAMVEGHGNG